MHYLNLHIFVEFQCDLGWDLFGKFCYKFVTAAKSKSEAENDCIVKGSHLASIHCTEEMDFLTQKTIQMNVWIGGERKGASFQWLDGTNFDYENWDGGQPGSNDPRGEHCLSWGTFGNPGKWHDAWCGNIFTYVCKKSVSGNCNSVNKFNRTFLIYTLK